MADTLYFKPANNGTPVALTGGGGGGGSSLNNWAEVGVDFVPNTAGTQDLGATDKPVGFLHINAEEGITSGLSWSKDYDGIPNTSGAWEQIHLTTRYAGGGSGQTNFTKADLVMLQNPLANSLNTNYLELRSFADLTTPGSAISWATQATLTDVTNLESTVDFRLYSGNSHNTLFTFYKSTANTQDFQVRYEVPLALASYPTAQLPTATEYRDGSLVFDETTTSMKMKVGNAWTEISGGGQGGGGGGGGGGSSFNSWSEDGAYNWVTDATKNIGSPNQHIGNIYMDISDNSTKSLFWTKSGTTNEMWGISPFTTDASGGSANPNALVINTKNDVAETSVGDGINVQQRYTSFTNLIFPISEQKTVFTDTTNVTQTGTNYSTAQEFWVAENVTLTKYLTLDGASTSVVFDKVSTLYKDTTVNLNNYSNLVEGMIAYDTTLNTVVYYDGNWVAVGGQGGNSLANWSESGIHLVPNSNGTQDLGSVTSPVKTLHLATFDGLDTGIVYSQDYNGTHQQVHRTNYSVAGFNSVTSHSKYERVILQDTLANSTNRTYSEGVVFADLTTPNAAFSHVVRSTILSPTNRETTVEFLHYSNMNETTTFSLFVDTANSQAHQVRYEVPLALSSYATAQLPTATEYREGSIVFDETTTSVKVQVGNAWVEVGGQGGGGGSGIQGGGGQSAALAIWTGTDSLSHNDQLQYDGAAHTMFLDSTNGNQGTYTHYANSGDASANWLVGRSENGEFYIRTQGGAYSADTVGSMDTADYNKGWRVTTGGDLVPTASLKVGLWGDEVARVHTLGVSGGTSGLKFYTGIGQSETWVWSISNTGALIPQDVTNNVSSYNIGGFSNRVNNIYCDTLYANATNSVRFLHTEGENNYEFALKVDISNLNYPVLTLNDLPVGIGRNVVAEQHSLVTSYGSSGSPMVYKVTVANRAPSHPYASIASPGGNAYWINGIQAPALQFSGVDSDSLNQGGGNSAAYSYRFDQSDSSNAGHPLRFYLSADKTTEYTTGVTVNGTPGQAGAYVQIKVDDNTPNILYYQCTAHSYMGNHATTISNTFNNSGTLVTVDDLVAGGGGATDKIIEGDTSVEVADTGGNGVVIIKTEGSEKWRIRTAGHLVPQGATGTLNIGQQDARVDEIYSQSSMFHYQDLAFNSLYTELTCGGTGALLGRLVQVVNNGSPEVVATHNDTLADFGSNFFDNHIIPTADTTYDLGSATNKWRDLYLDGNTIYIGESTLSLNIGNPADKYLELDGVRLPTKFADMADIDNAKTATTGHVLKRKADGRFAFEEETAGSVGNRIQADDSSLRIADAGASGSLLTLKLDNVNRLHFTADVIYPQTTDTYDLGTSSKTFAQVHTKEVELYENGSSTPSGTLSATASDTIGTDAQVFVTKDHRYTQQTNHSTPQSEFRGLAIRTARMGNQSRIIQNTDQNTWKTNATDNARNGMIVPMFALATERVKTLSVQKGIWTNSGDSFRTKFYIRNGSTQNTNEIYEDYYRLDWPKFGLTDFSNTVEGAFGWCSTVNQNSASCGFLGQLDRTQEVQTLQFQEFLDENVRGFGHAHLFDGDGNPGSSVLSFIVKMKGVKRLDVKIVASKCSWSGQNSSWKDSVIATETFSFSGTQIENEFEGVLTVDNEIPVRLEDISERFGQVTVEIKIHLRDQSAGEGPFLNRTIDYFTYSDLRLNLFSS